MRRPIAAAALLALVVLVVAAALDRREVAFVSGLPAFDLVGEFRPGAEVCASDVDVPAAFQRVRIVVGTEARPQPLEVTVTDLDTGREAGAGRFPGGDADAGGNVEMAVGDVPAGRRVRVCVTNAGTAGQRFFGSPPNREATEPPVLAVVFVREEPASLLSLVPEMAERSSRFKPGFYGEWTAWALLALAVLVVPLALGRALAAAYTSDRSYSRAGTEDGSERSS